jgi:hypothetical protein
VISWHLILHSVSFRRLGLNIERIEISYGSYSTNYSQRCDSPSRDEASPRGAEGTVRNTDDAAKLDSLRGGNLARVRFPPPPSAPSFAV